MEKANVASAGLEERWRINAEVCDLSYCPGPSVGVTHPVPLYPNATGPLKVKTDVVLNCSLSRNAFLLCYREDCKMTSHFNDKYCSLDP